MIRVLVADDHPVVRSGVRNLLRDETNIRVAAEAKTAAEVLHQIGTREFDVILLDVTLPDGSGIDLIADVRSKSPKTQVVMCTNVPNQQARCLELGAVAYLSKETPADVLVKAIEAASRQPSGTNSTRGKSAESEQPFRQYNELSRRELEIMLKLIAGKRNKEIALELDISPDKVAQLQRVGPEPLSLEGPVGEAEDSHLSDYIEDRAAVAPEEAASTHALREELEKMMDILSEREQEVVRLKFGLADGHSRTIEEVAAYLHLSRERVRQVEASAMKKLQKPSSRKRLEEYI